MVVVDGLKRPAVIIKYHAFAEGTRPQKISRQMTSYHPRRFKIAMIF